MTAKITVSLPDETAAYARAHAPDGNVSAYIDRIIRRQITLDTAPFRAPPRRGAPSSRVPPFAMPYAPLRQQSPPLRPVNPRQTPQTHAHPSHTLYAHPEKPLSTTCGPSVSPVKPPPPPTHHPVSDQ